jgi:DNA-binding NtrC family response regulator
VLVAEDDRLLARAMRRALVRHGYEVDVASNGRDAKEMLDEGEYAALVLDLGMPIADGWSVLAHRRASAHRPTAIVITGEVHRDLALQAMRAGASDVLEKPVDPGELAARIDHLLAVETGPQVVVPIARSRPAPPSARRAKPIVAESAAMKEVLALADRVARSPATSALLLGESGVGKEVVATWIHERSGRAAEPFVRVNLAALPPTMVEAELFGSVRGAFTGAQQDRIGLLGSASGGTLLLDELCEFDPGLQPKLLRVLEERRYYPVGSDRQRDLDVRLLCATNREPDEAIAAGRLRADLFYRVSTVVLRIPPLRDRPDDVLPLARALLAEVAPALGRPKLTLGAEAERALLEHDWPGNVRELRNVVERAAIVAERIEVGPSDLDLGRAGGRPPAVWRSAGLDSDTPEAPLARARGGAVAAVEKRRIVEALAKAGGSPTRAASLLGIARSTLWAKMKLYGIER